MEISLSDLISCSRASKSIKESKFGMISENVCGIMEIENKANAEIMKRTPYGGWILAAADAVNVKKEDEAEKKLAESFPPEKVKEILSAIREAKRYNIISDTGIYHLYNSGDPEWQKAAATLAVCKYHLYIHKYVHTHYGSYGQDYYDDYLSSCFEAVMVALKSYTPEKGAFATYTTMWFRHFCGQESNSIHNEQTSHYGKIQVQISKAIKKLQMEGHAATPENIAVETGLDLSTVNTELQYLKNTNFVYLNDDASLKDVSDTYENSPEHIAEVNNDRRALNDAVMKLPKQMREILVLRFAKGRSSEAISRATGIPSKKVKSMLLEAMALLGEDAELRKTVGAAPSIRNMKEEKIETEPPKERDAVKQLEQVMSLVNNGLKNTSSTDSIYGDDLFSGLISGKEKEKGKRKDSEDGKKKE